MDLGIKGKFALVTGGSRGLGKAAAISLAKEGVNVAICGRTESDLNKTVQEIKSLGVDSKGFIVDISDLSKLEDTYNVILEQFGDIDILVNAKNMGELMFNHDLAFVAGGDTALELAYTGTPGIVVPTIDYENKIAEFLEKNKIFINLGDIKTNSKHGIRIKIDLFWNDNNKRKTFSENSKRFIDGKGLSRIIKNTDLC